MAIQFLKGTSASFNAEGFTPVEDVFYILTDTHDFYLGNTKLSNGADLADAVASISKNAEDIIAIQNKLIKLENSEETEGSIRNIIRGYIDDVLSETSTNAVQNKVVTAALNTKADKADTYTKSEVDALVNEATTGRFVPVDELPTEDIDKEAIYLLPKPEAQEENIYDEYINPTGTADGWEKIGDTKLDLSGYVKKEDVEDALSATSVNPVQNKVVKAELDKKTVEVLNGANGVARVWNESDGGGVKFEHKDGTYSFVGVNDGGKDSVTGQLYSVDKNNGNVGTRLNMTNSGFFYTNGASSPAFTSEDEIATKKDISDAALTWGTF